MSAAARLDPWEPVQGRIVRRLRGWLLREPTFELARRFRAFYQGTRAQVEARAFERLRALLMHARDTVPVHAQRMASIGLVPERLTLADRDAALAGLPVLTRADVAGRLGEFTSSAFRPEQLQVVRTGGSTGDPVPFVQDRGGLAQKEALALHLRQRLGWEPGAKSAYLWGAAHDLPRGARGRLKRWRDHLEHAWVNRALYLPAGDLSDATLDRHIAALQRFRPTWLQGYPTATDLLARRVLARGLHLHVPRVLLTAEPVLPVQRERIRQGLGASVLAFYGSRECGWLASECPTHGGAHVNVAGAHLESTADGRLLVTDLCNRALPLVRYEIGDRGRLSPEPCPCGDPRPLLAGLEGRLLDMFVLPSGRRVPGVIPDVRGIQRDALGIDDARLVQNDLHSLDVSWVAGPNFRPEHFEAFRRFLDETFFHELTLRFERVERLPVERNGKVRRCLSRVADAAPGRSA